MSDAEEPPADPFGLRPAGDDLAGGDPPDDGRDPDEGDDLGGDLDPVGALDPDAAIVDGDGYRGPALSPLVVRESRKAQRRILGLGAALVVALSIFLAVHGGGSGGTAGIPAGQRMLRFVAPLATSDLDNPAANAHPVCNPARPSRRGLNVCDRRPLVLAFFATGEKQCVQQVDTLQTVSARFPTVQFAAVAVDADRAATDKLVRAHHWTIPVAYDVTGALGELFGVEVCPIIEIVKGNGIVDQRLVGKYWLPAAKLTAAVAKLGG